MLGWATAAVLALTAAGCAPLAQTEGNTEGTMLRYRRVTPEVAHYLLRDSPDVLLLDLRAESALAADPVPELRQARRLPLAELAARAAELEPYRNRTFLVYCGGDSDCGRAGMRLLIESGCVYAVLIDGTLDDWAEKPAPEKPAPADPPPPAAAPPL